MANRIRFTTAAQVANAFPASVEAVGVEMGEALSPVEFLRTFLEAEEPLGGVSFAAYAFPKREGIFWGCLCMRELGILDADGLATLAVTEAWLRKPDEEERRAAGAIAAEQEFGNPATLLAQAAFCSGGSIGPAEFEAVAPDPDLTAKCLSGGMLFALGAAEPTAMDENAKKCIASAIDFAEGGDGKAPWGAGS